MGWQDKLNQIFTDIKIQILNEYNELQSNIISNFWDYTTEILSCIIITYIFWCCLCIIMYREKVYVPPFGEAKPMDNLYYLFSLYFIIRFLGG